jgi:hydrogenase maturation protease
VRIRVIGVGSEHGHDSAGLAVAERLQRRPLPAGVEVVACTRPGLDLLDELSGADAVILADAVRSGAPVGTARWIPIAALRSQHGLSSHGLGVAEVLGLAAALGRCPDRIEVIGIEADDFRPGASAEALAAGIDAAVEAILARLGEFDTRTPGRASMAAGR